MSGEWVSLGDMGRSAIRLAIKEQPIGHDQAVLYMSEHFPLTTKPPKNKKCPKSDFKFL